MTWATVPGIETPALRGMVIDMGLVEKTLVTLTYCKMGRRAGTPYYMPDGLYDPYDCEDAVFHHDEYSLGRLTLTQFIPGLNVLWQVHTINQCLSVRPSVCPSRSGGPGFKPRDLKHIISF